MDRLVAEDIERGSHVASRVKEKLIENLVVGSDYRVILAVAGIGLGPTVGCNLFGRFAVDEEGFVAALGSYTQIEAPFLQGDTMYDPADNLE